MHHLSFKTLIFCFLLLNAFNLFAKDNTAMNDSLKVDTETLDETKQTTDIDQQEQKYYAIEIILFRHKNTANNTELWAKVDDTEAIESLAEAYFANYQIAQKNLIIYDNNNVFPLIPEIAQLSEKSQTIRYAPEYQLLSYFGWIQKGLPKEQAKAVQLSFDEQNTQLSGKISVYLSRYLHTKIHLESIEQVCRLIKDAQQDEIKIKVQTSASMKEGETQAVSEEKEPKAVEEPQYHCQMEKILFHQQRKMRSRELHYIDHPVFGLLVEITPLEKEQIKALPVVDDSIEESIKAPIIEENNIDEEQNNRALQGEL